MNRACLPSPCSWALALALCCAPAWAQLEIQSSPNAVGSGARALGMGAAFTAIADDATAASWNPGGLTQLERPEFSLVLSHKLFSEEFNSGTHPELDGSYDVDFSDFNYISFVYPLQRTIAGRNLVFSLNYQTKFDFDRDIDTKFRNIFATSRGDISSQFSDVKYRQRGRLAALSPAVAFELTEKLSLGLVVNIWDQSILPDNGWTVEKEFRTTTRVNGILNAGSFGTTREKERYDDFEGMNFTVGTLFKPNPRWSIGATYNSKFTADVNYSLTQRGFLSASGLRRGNSERSMEYVFPASFALGVAYRFPNDKLTLSMDITRREWDQFVIHDPENRDRSQRRRSGVTGQSMRIAPEIDPTYTVRVGMEYVFVNPSKPRQDYLPSIRAGVFYDPEPSGGRKSTLFGLDSGDGSNDKYYGFSLGTGVLIKDRVNIDAAYTYRWGDGVRGDTYGLAETDADVDQHYLYLSTVIYF